MYHCFGAQINIGGPVPRFLVEDLCAAILRQRVMVGGLPGCFAPRSAEDLLKVRQEWDGAEVLCLVDDRALEGELRILETFLLSRSIAFNRYSDPCGMRMAQLVVYRPRKADFCLMTDPNHEPVTWSRRYDLVLGALAESIKLLEQKKFDRGLRAVRRAQRFLLRLVPEIPPLEEFTITDE